MAKEPCWMCQGKRKVMTEDTLSAPAKLVACPVCTKPAETPEA